VVAGWGVGGLPPVSLGYVSGPAFLVLAVVAALVAPLGAAIAHRLNAGALNVSDAPR
jgi:hypothetical protein